MLAEGAKAPSFHLPRDGGGMIALSDFAGKKLVLFFYPRADTPGCTREAIDFTRLKGAFAELQGNTNAVADRLTEVMGRLQETSHRLKTATGEILAGSNDLAERTSRQADVLQRQ